MIIGVPKEIKISENRVGMTEAFAGLAHTALVALAAAAQVGISLAELGLQPRLALLPLLLGELQHGQREEIDELLHRIQQDLRPRHRRLDIEDETGMAVEGQVAGSHHVTELLAGAQLVEEGG